MNMELASFIDKLAIDGVFLFPFNGNHDGLLHFIGNDYAHAFFS
jgi:hypothetical protein